MGNMRRRAWLSGVLAALLILTLTGAAQAVDYCWDVESGNWDVPGNWDLPGIPTSSDNARIDDYSWAVKVDVFIPGGVSAQAHDLIIGFDTPFVNHCNNVVHNRGSLTVSNDLILGDRLNAEGTLYNSGVATVRGDAIVGRERLGTVVCYSSFEVTGSLTLGALPPRGHGIFWLDKGSLDTQNTNTIVGGGGEGRFINDGGDHKVIRLTLGRDPGSLGTYELCSEGKLNAAFVVVGQSGEGRFEMSEGDLWTFDLQVGLNASSGGSWFRHTSGNVHILSFPGLVIGVEPGSNASYEMSPDPSFPTPSLTTSAITVGRYGTGRFTMSGGAIEAEYVEVGDYGAGTFEQSGGSHTVSGTLTVANNPGSTGDYVLSGTGELTVGSLVVKPGGNFRQIGGTSNIGPLENAAVFDLSGGTSTVTGKVTNKAGSRFSSSNSVVFHSLDNQAGAEFILSHNPAAVNFSGPVDNAGRMEVTNTTVIYHTLFSNFGAYVSDPATSRFLGDVKVAAEGYLVGGLGDRFEMGADFWNTSSNSTEWRTEQAGLIFIGDKEHKFQIPSLDQGGGTPEGYVDNFAWGLLDLTGETLFLQDDGTPEGALYVRRLLGLKFDDPDNPKTILNIHSLDGLNLFYDPGFNPDLLGLTLALQGGGSLAPAVPLPGAVWLLGSGLLALVGLGRLRKS